MREKVQNTASFLKLENFKKRIYSNSKNIAEIERLYGIALRLGVEYMVQSQNPNRTEKLIINDLLNN